MTEAEIKSFISICRHRSISKAAAELFISQSSLSLRLKTLEDQLGCPLLLRGKGKREITLTTQGQSFYALALQYEEIIEKMESVGKGNLTETLRVSVIASVGTYLMADVFHLFMEQYPNIRLTVQDMEAEEASNSIIRGKTDLAFSTAKVQTDQIVATPFLADPMTVVCAVDSPYPDQVTLAMLPPDEEILIRWCADLNFWHDTVFASDTHPQLELDLMGRIERFLTVPSRWAFVPESVARVLCKYPHIRRCEPQFPLPDRRVYILRHCDHAVSPSIQCFLDTLKAVLQEKDIPGVLI